MLGQVIGLGVDAQDHVWIVHRDRLALGHGSRRRPEAADRVVLFEGAAGPRVRSGRQPRRTLGRPAEGYEWPTSNHGIFIDYKDNVWIGGNGDKDAHVLKFTQDGKFLMQIGRQGKRVGSNDLENFGRVAKIFVDPKTNEAYIADGYENKRVVVIDADTGQVQALLGRVRQQARRHGSRPLRSRTRRWRSSSARRCTAPSCRTTGCVYVCDRPNDRIQVFKADGTFVKETFVARNTLGDGSTWDIAFSKDPQQKYIYLADGKNEKVYILDRQSLEILTSFGDGGRQPGQFFAVHSIATDSKGNLYTTETYEGRRLQKFVYKGIGPVTKMDQGTVWPAK